MPTIRHGFATACVLSVVVAGHLGWAKGSGSPAPDLAKIIECRADLTEFHDLGTKLGPDLSGAPLGWKRVSQSNTFLTEYELPKPIKVFGHSTRRIAAAGSSLLAIFDGVKPEALGAQLHLQPVALAPGRSILARIVKQASDDLGTTIIRINVSTVDTHPGKVLAGCEYSVELK